MLDTIIVHPEHGIHHVVDLNKFLMVYRNISAEQVLAVMSGLRKSVDGWTLRPTQQATSNKYVYKEPPVQYR